MHPALCHFHNHKTVYHPNKWIFLVFLSLVNAFLNETSSPNHTQIFFKARSARHKCTFDNFESRAHPFSNSRPVQWQIVARRAIFK